MSNTATISKTIEQAVLNVPRLELLWQKIGGMTVLERHLFTVYRSGIKHVWINAPKPDENILASLRLPADLNMTWSLENKPVSPYLNLSADHFIRVGTLSDIIKNGGESFDYQALPNSSQLNLQLPLDRKKTTTWLMAVGPKPQDGMMARYFDRNISMTVSTLLLETFVTPNMMTLFSTSLGLFGSLLFLGRSKSAAIFGAGLIWLHSVLDGCDGELARVRFQESAFGSDLDFWGDNLVHLFLFSCLGIGFWLQGMGTHALVLSAVADLGVLASAITAWDHRRKSRLLSKMPKPEAGVVAEKNDDSLTSRLSRLQNSLAQRDFIYLLFFLAVIGHLYEFLWAAAVGGIMYFTLMLYLRRINENE